MMEIWLAKGLSNGADTLLLSSTQVAHTPDSIPQRHPHTRALSFATLLTAPVKVSREQTGKRYVGFFQSSQRKLDGSVRFVDTIFVIVKGH